MAGKKGMKKYPTVIRNEIVEKNRQGQSVKSLSEEYGISRYAIQSWCGLRPEVNLRQAIPLRRGRKPAAAVTLQDYKRENKRLKMENELLRDFLHLAGRK